MNWNWMVVSSLLLLSSVEIQSQEFLNSVFEIYPGGDPGWQIIGNSIQKKLEGKGIISNIILELVRDFFLAVKSSSFPTAVATNISQRCIDDSQFYVESLYRNRSLWALQMQESTGQLPLGLFGSTNLNADGLFDECLAVRSPLFEGQYCTVAFKPELVDPADMLPPTQTEKDLLMGRRNYITIVQILGQLSDGNRVVPKVMEANTDTHYLPSIGFCLPSSCNATDLGQSIAQLIGSYVIGNRSVVTVADEQLCFKNSKEIDPIDGIDIVVIVVLSLLVLIILSATIHESWRMCKGVYFDLREDNKAISALHCFSVLNNGRKVISMKPTKTSSDNDNLDCLHGIRVLATCWVVIGHTWDYCFHIALNRKKVQEDILAWRMQMVSNGVMFVDTFFVISGLLVSYHLLRELERNKGRLNIGLFYLRRYLRFTPTYAIVLAFMATLVIYVGSGPNWFNVETSVFACRKTWWQHFLYINNFFPAEQDTGKCMGHTWFLAANMQLFLLSPLFIYPLYRWKKLGIAWLLVVMLVSHVGIIPLYASYDISSDAASRAAGQGVDTGTDEEYFKHYYVKPWTRASAYLMGILAGWCLHITRESKTRLSKVWQIVVWITFLVMLLGYLYGIPPHVDETVLPEMSVFIKLTFGPVHRTAWTIVLSWLIFACARGYAGFVNRFLSYKGFRPFSRLTFCVFLIHYDYLNVFYAINRKQPYYSMLAEVTTCFGIIVTSFILAFVISITLEMSFLNLEKFVASKFEKSKSSEASSTPADSSIPE